MCVCIACAALPSLTGELPPPRSTWWPLSSEKLDRCSLVPPTLALKSVRFTRDMSKLFDSRRRSPLLAVSLALLASVTLAACAVGPTYSPPSTTAVSAWHAPLPHDGDVTALAGWWARWNDATLVELIEAAQATNATLDQAAARIRQARAGEIVAGASLLPAINGSASASRGNLLGQSLGLGALSSVSASAQAAWEIDLFGANRRGREAATARLGARSLDWHQARVSLAADVAANYANLRVNEALVTGYERDAASRQETSRLTGLKTDAGFEAPANAALARASASEAAARLTAQRAEVNFGVKALVALTGLDESALRNTLAAGRAQVPSGANLRIDQVPANVLAQRPDLAASERELAALTADIGAADAEIPDEVRGPVGFSPVAHQVALGKHAKCGRVILARTGRVITRPCLRRSSGTITNPRRVD